MMKRFGSVGFLMGAVLLAAFALQYGYALCGISDDDPGDFSSFLSNGFIAAPVDPYVPPSLKYIGPFVLGGREVPLIFLVTPVCFSRSPPQALS